MRTLDALPPEKRERISQETLDIYSPLAHRLGIWEIKWRLDDLAFRHLHPKEYREISKILATRRAEREEYVDRVATLLIEELKEFDVSAEVTGRPKGIYSIYQKMQKYADQGKELSDIYDLYALRVLVDNKADCYKALGVVHQRWSPIPGQFDGLHRQPQGKTSTKLCTPPSSAKRAPPWKCKSRPTICTRSRNTAWPLTGVTRRARPTTCASRKR